MKKLLIVSPRFAPWTSADNQRVLAMLPCLRELGWQACVATVDCADLGLPEDPLLVPILRAQCEWRTVTPLPLRWTRRLGVRSLALRASRRLDRLVRAWHVEVGFDLVLVSTTEFGFWHLAPNWWRDLRLPYVLDWQDPWRSDYYRQRPALVPPGGRIKFGLMQAWARWREPAVARAAAAHVGVSAHYIELLRVRYPEIPTARCSVIPFSAGAAPVGAAVLDRQVAGPRYWAYAGVCGDVMQFTLSAFFRALARQRQVEPQRFADLRLKFVGTSYADPTRARPSVLPIAERCGVGDMVDESPLRVAPDQVRALLLGAEALLVPGSDDPGYVASKLQSCLALDKPLLALFHADSDAVSALAGQAGVVACTFAATDAAAAESLSEDIREHWLARDVAGFPLQPRRLEDHSPRAMTARLVAVFDRACADVRAGGVER